MIERESEQHVEEEPHGNEDGDMDPNAQPPTPTDTTWTPPLSLDFSSHEDEYIVGGFLETCSLDTNIEVPEVPGGAVGDVGVDGVDSDDDEIPPLPSTNLDDVKVKTQKPKNKIKTRSIQIQSVEENQSDARG